MPAKQLTTFITVISLCTITQIALPGETGHHTSIRNGMTEKEVISILGQPKGTISVGLKTTLMYDGAQIQLLNGVATDLPDNLSDLLEEGKRKRETKESFIKTQKRKGLVQYKGKWVKPAVRQDLEAKAMLAMQEERARIEKAAKNSYVMRDQNNEPISHSQYLSHGSVTVLDFYAEWCGPCKTLAPKLEQLVDTQSGVILRKVDIDTWGSPVATRYNINSVPNVRVFDRNGNMIGPPTSNLRTIASYIEQAKKQ